MAKHLADFLFVVIVSLNLIDEYDNGVVIDVIDDAVMGCDVP